MQVILEPIEYSPEERDRAWFVALEVLHRLHVKRVLEELKRSSEDQPCSVKGRRSRSRSGGKGPGALDCTRRRSASSSSAWPSAWRLRLAMLGLDDRPPDGSFITGARPLF